MDLKFINWHSFDAIIRLLRTNGIAMIGGLSSIDDLVHLSQKVGKPIKHRDANQNGVITLRPRDEEQQETFKGYTRKEQYLHTDGPIVSNPADVVVLYCDLPAIKGGESTFVDGKNLFYRLAEEDPELLRALMDSDAGIFGEPPNDVQIKPVFRSYDFNRLGICFRNDKLVTYSKIIQDKFDYLIETINGLTTHVKLNAGEGYIVNNNRFIHGRRSFTGDRIIHRVQLHSYPSNHIPLGFSLD